MNVYQEISQIIKEADGILIGASNGLSIAEGYNIFADDKIGALWVNPSTCKPVGSTIGHEIGHSFQYQVSADKSSTCLS